VEKPHAKNFGPLVCATKLEEFHQGRFASILQREIIAAELESFYSTITDLWFSRTMQLNILLLKNQLKLKKIKVGQP